MRVNAENEAAHVAELTPNVKAMAQRFIHKFGKLF